MAPWFVLVVSAFLTPERGESSNVSTVALVLACVAITVQITHRFLLAARFKQALIGVFLHPVAMTVFTALQWWSLVLHVTGRRSWRGRPG